MKTNKTNTTWFPNIPNINIIPKTIGFVGDTCFPSTAYDWTNFLVDSYWFILQENLNTARSELQNLSFRVISGVQKKTMKKPSFEWTSKNHPHEKNKFWVVTSSHGSFTMLNSSWSRLTSRCVFFGRSFAAYLVPLHVTDTPSRWHLEVDNGFCVNCVLKSWRFHVFWQGFCCDMFIVV